MSTSTAIAMWRQRIRETKAKFAEYRDALSADLDAATEQFPHTLWTEPGKGCEGCRHCCYSPYDDPYCSEPIISSFNPMSPDAGWNINKARRKCKGFFREERVRE